MYYNHKRLLEILDTQEAVREILDTQVYYKHKRLLERFRIYKCIKYYKHKRAARDSGYTNVL